jgi:Ras-related protein Rab-21
MSGRSYKVVLLGEGRVGKSSIIMRFVQNKYDDRQQSTLSASCFDKNISLGGSESARISLWDTAGQERFHALGPLYYRDAGGCAAAATPLLSPRCALGAGRWGPL